MAEVTIMIDRASVLSDMKVKSHAQMVAMSDPKQRYLAELGSEKHEEAGQCISDAASGALALMHPLAKGSGTGGYAVIGSITFTLNLTSRKSGVQEPLKAALHTYIVDGALARYYGAVNQPSLAQMHAARLADDGAAIEMLLFRKSEPKTT